MYAYADAANRQDAMDRHARLIDAALVRSGGKPLDAHRKALAELAGFKDPQPKRDPNRVSLAEQARRRKGKG